MVSDGSFDIRPRRRGHHRSPGYDHWLGLRLGHYHWLPLALKRAVDSGEKLVVVVESRIEARFGYPTLELLFSSFLPRYEHRHR